MDDNGEMTDVVEETAAEEAPSEEAPPEEIPPEEAPPEEIPPEETSPEEAPLEEAPEESPAEEAPSPRQAQRAATRATKEALIAQAELVAMVSAPSTAAAEMRALFEQWKQAGRTTKSEDDALWARFNQAQDQLFTRLNLLREQRQAQAAEAKRLKESLIATAEDLAGRSDIHQAAETMASLMSQWKKIGTAPDDKGLWLRFKAAQDRLYSRRDEERGKARTEQEKAAETKRALIAQTQGLVGAPDLRAANADLRSFQTRFRETGYAGRDNKKLGEQFRRAQQAFYAWVRQEPARRRDSGEQGTYGKRARLAQQIEQVKAQIAQAEETLKSTDRAGAKKSHGKSITVTLGEKGAYTSAAAETLRLTILLTDLENQVRSLDAKLARDRVTATPLEEGTPGEDSSAEDSQTPAEDSPEEELAEGTPEE